MPITLIGVFPSYQEAKNAIEDIRKEDPKDPITIMNRLPKIPEEKSSLKLDGVISGVSDVFIGLTPFVNPLSASGLPPQSPPDTPKESRSTIWEKYGIEERHARKYQQLMEGGKTIVALQCHGDWDRLQEAFRLHNAEMVHRYKV